MRGGLQTPGFAAIAIGGAMILGVVVATNAAYAVVVIAAALFSAVFFIADRQALPYVTLGVLLCVPFDFLGPFADTLQGFPVIAVAAGGVVLALLSPSRPLREIGRSGWDVWLITAAFLITFTINGVGGGVRQALMLLAGILFYLWVRMSFTGGSRAKELLLNTILVVGVIHGVGALVERAVGASTFAGLVPTYEPFIKEFTSTMGTRAVSLAGHPLRLGAIEMTGVIAGFALSRGSSGRRRVVIAAAIVVCATGLLLSGARGAWLSTFMGAIALLLFTPGAESLRLAFKLTAATVLGWAALAATGVLTLVNERLFGAASRPASVAQRVAVLATTTDVWRSRPLQGYGWGTYLQEIYARGFQYANTENQYVDFVLAGGALTLASFTAVCVNGLGRVWRHRHVTLMPALGGILVAWIVSIGTYNAFSWSTAFPFFMTVLATIADGSDA